jgi:hypothetical protein
VAPQNFAAWQAAAETLFHNRTTTLSNSGLTQVKSKKHPPPFASINKTKEETNMLKIFLKIKIVIVKK